MASVDRPTVDLISIVEYVENVVSIARLILNSLLFYLILYKTNAQLMDYRPILLQNCVIDSVYNFLNFINKEQSDYKNGYMYVSMVGPLANLPTPWNLIMMVLWVNSIMSIITSIPVQFIYRYFLICRGVKLSKLAYTLVLLFANFFGVMYGVFTFLIFSPDPEILSASRKLLEVDKYYYAGIPNYMVASVDGNGLKFLVFYNYFICGSSYGIAIFANFKVWRYLKMMKSSMTPQLKEAHRQITVSLAFQAAIPCCVCFIPVVTAMTLVILRANIPGVGIGISLIWSWIPVANPLLTIIVVRCYRDTVTTKFRKLLPSLSSNHSVSPVVVSVSGNLA